MLRFSTDEEATKLAFGYELHVCTDRWRLTHSGRWAAHGFRM